MMEHPKYTLVAVDKNSTTHPFEIREHVATMVDGHPGWMSKCYCDFRTFDEAILEMARLSTGPVVLAYSAQPIDNTFDIRQG
jgi:hypothetical protein